MLINSSEIKQGVRERYLLKDNEFFQVEEIEKGTRTRLRRFKLTNLEGKSVGIFYEDYLPKRVLEGA